MKLLFLLFSAASGNILLKSDATLKTIKDSIEVAGDVIAQGDGVRGLIDKCAPLTKHFTEAKVCGCNYKLHVYLTADCKDYHEYQHTVGKCDCSVEGCEDGVWSTGYSKKVNWKASSYKVEKCQAGR